MNRHPKLALFALLFGVAATPLLAHGSAHGRPQRGGGALLDDDRMDRMAEHNAERLTRALDLTSAQQTTLDRLQNELEATVRPLAVTMRTARDEMQRLLDTASPDPAAVGTQAIAMDHARDGMKAAREKFEADFAAGLTETQRATFHALQELRPDGERFGRDFRGGHGGERGERQH
ncbi:MAG: periplasmic heavy metal sensor [Thermoanaerobaculia bacterium]